MKKKIFTDMFIYTLWREKKGFGSRYDATYALTNSTGVTLKSASIIGEI